MLPWRPSDTVCRSPPQRIRALNPARPNATARPAPARRASRPRVLLLGPALAAVSGVSTHLAQLFRSGLAGRFDLLHFQVGSEGRREGALQKLARFLFSPLQLALVILRRRPDIVHLNTSLMPKSFWRDLAYLAVARALGRRVVYQVHGGALPADFAAGRRDWSVVLRRVLSWPDAVVLLARVELDAYRAFVPGQRLELIPNAIELEPLVSMPLHGRSEGPLRLVYLGRFVRTKGVFECCDALASLAREGHAFAFTMAGSGPEEPSLRAHVEALGLGDRVRFVGPRFGDEKIGLWRETDVFLLPTWGEGLPYALLEAMAAGAVPVATRVGAIPDVVEHEVHGMLVAPREPAAIARALARLDEDRALLRRLAEAARARVVAHYGMARLEADFERLYGSLCGVGRS
uniref:Glycosyltransferase family 1 protein n=1 Tax=Eiseniibacteriota bacterium TaxID=2212470 RepID=A0A832MM61_UNCEI